jgi:uncharacterized protein (TIGR02145 family)
VSSPSFDFLEEVQKPGNFNALFPDERTIRLLLWLYKKRFMNKMRYRVNIRSALLANALLFSCINYEANAQMQTDTLRDRDGNGYTIKVMPDNKKWTTDNLKINIPGSYCYEDAEQKCNQYGRLYTWKAANEGCKLLGEEWRLPTDTEWQQMARGFGGANGDSKDSGKTAYQALLSGGNAAFNALLGGGREPGNGRYARLEAHGFYWTATEDDTILARYYNFGKGSQKLFRQTEGEKERAFSVRCIRDTGNLKEQQYGFSVA